MDDCAAVYEWMKGGIKLIYSLIDGVAVNSQHTGPPSPDSTRIQEAGADQNILDMGYYYSICTKPYFPTKCLDLSYFKLELMQMAFNQYL